MLKGTHIQIINIYSIKTGLQVNCDTSCTKKGWYESDVDSEELYRSVSIHTIKVPLLLQ